MDIVEKIGLGNSHGKIILMGEHSVVYGHKAIAMPFVSNPVITKISESNNGINLISSLYSGNIKYAPLELNHLVEVIAKTLNEFSELNKNINIEIISNLPLQRGLGSSAAVVSASIRALYSFYRKKLSDEKLLELTDFAENIAHGNSSGIDSRATVFSEALIFSKNSGIEELKINMEEFLIIADTGIKGKTKIAVSKVRENYDKNKNLIENLSKYTNEAINAIRNKNAINLGNLMLEAHNCLKKMDISHEKLDDFVEISIKNNALGAKLTGGGLGGCMISLAENQTIAEKIKLELEKNGAINVWIQKMKN